jgi:hypothetical protein
MKSTTQAFPLLWPDGWPKTPAAERGEGKQFVTVGRKAGQTWKSSSPVTFDRARQLLCEELDRLGATNVTISTNVPLRADGMPSGNAADRIYQEPGIALYFMLKGRAMVMAQDAYKPIAANMRSLGLAVEAMRSLERHGGGTMMNKAFDGFLALPAPAGSKPKRPWWTVLRYSENPEDRDLLSVAEVNARFNTLAKKLHPDAGGDADEMAELNAARQEAITELGGES